MLNDEYEGSGDSLWINQARPVPAFIHRSIVADGLHYYHHVRDNLPQKVRQSFGNLPNWVDPPPSHEFESVFLVLQKLVVSMVEKMLLQPNNDQKHFYERLFEIQLFQSNVLGKKKRTLQVEDGLPVIDCRRCTGATSPTCSQTLRQKMFPEVFKHNLTLPTTSPSFTNSNPPSICGTNKIIRVRHWAKKVCELILIPWFKWTEHGK